MFNKGMFVTGKEDNGYAYTTNQALMIVKDMGEEANQMIVTIIGYNPSVYGMSFKSYPVRINDFIEVTNVAEFVASHPDWEFNEDVEIVEAPKTAMNTTMTMPMSDEWKENMIRQIGDLLEEYDYGWTHHGVDVILKEWHKNKQWIEFFLSKHPNWDAERKMIVLSNEYNRSVNLPVARRAVDRIYRRWMRELSDKLTTEGKLFSNNDEDGYEYFSLGENGGFMLEDNAYETYMLINNIKSIFNMFEDNRNFANPLFIKHFNIFVESAKKICPGIFNEKFSAHKGEKNTKLFRRMCVELGLDKWVEMGYNGRRDVNMGFNHWYTIYADAINPAKVKQYTCISINPIDYLTMSFGNTWGSCHTIDKENKRGLDKTYSGCYSSGTLSYMLDGASIVMYTVSKSYDGKDYQLQPKIKRCMFHIGEDKIVQGRVYPDGRDGGDEGLSAQMRAVMQKIIADLFEYDNLWIVRKGSSACDRVTYSHGTHYKDYIEYGDGTVSYVKHANGSKNMEVIHIGHNPICPDCGCEHSTEEWITCEECREERCCDRCGSYIGRGDGIWTADGNIYCCEDCAREAGYVCCDNGEWHTIDNCIYDDYLDEYVYIGYCGDYIIIAHNGREYTFANSENADDYGFRYCTDGEWHMEDECEENEDGEYVYTAA